MTKPADPVDFKETLRLFFQVLDASRDVERNKDDDAFRVAGGSIAYVFDANLFEIFVDPHDTRGRMTSLHADAWTSGRQAPGWRSYVAQTALSTAEYLVNGRLPGQRRDMIYMTEWHRWELQRRIAALGLHQVAQLRRSQAESALAPFADMQKWLEAFDKNPDGFESLIRDADLASDIGRLREQNPSKHDLRAYLAARLSVEALAEDRLMEPAEQLQRIVTAPLRERFSTLHLRYRINDEDRQEIANDAREWRRRLRAECDLHGIELHGADGHSADGAESGRRRSEGAVWDDARSLALVRWAAGRTGRDSQKERLAFVTADAVLFDAYRRWFANLGPSDAAYTEPFILRRAAQYAPVFNLVNSHKLEGKKYYRLFQDMEQVLEYMLLPLNLSRLASKAPEAVMLRMRELTALRLTNLDNVATDVAYTPLVDALMADGAKHHRDLVGLIDDWRAFERAALGQADEQIAHRIGENERRFAGLEPGSVSDAFERYVNEIVNSLLAGSREMSLPFAREFIDDWNPRSGAFIRAPIALHIILKVGHEEIDVGERLDQRAMGDAAGPLLDAKGWEALQREPAIVFAIATAQCVIARDLSNARHFSEMALLSAQGLQAGPPKADGDTEAEVKYLAALVKRFRMGEIGPPTGAGLFQRLQAHYSDALALLDECVAFYDGSSAEEQRFLSMRTLAERAALKLFFAIALNPAVGEAIARRRPAGHGGPSAWAMQELDDGTVPAHLGFIALEGAEADLKECLAIDRNLPPKVKERFRKRVERQFYSTLAAVGVLRRLSATESSEPQLATAGQQVRETRDAYEAQGGHPLLLSIVNGFLALCENDSVARRAVLASPVTPGGAAATNLDVALVDAIHASLKERQDARVAL